MLLRFEVSNYRSIAEPVELSMIAVDEDRPAARSFDLLPERVLTVAGIYGPNASGKSNVLDALAWLSFAVRTSLRSWERAVPRDPSDPHHADFGDRFAGQRIRGAALRRRDRRHRYAQPSTVAAEASHQSG